MGGPNVGDTSRPVSPQVQAVKLIAEGRAPRLPQPEDGATYEGIQKKETAQVSARALPPKACLCPGWGKRAARTYLFKARRKSSPSAGSMS